MRYDTVPLGTICNRVVSGGTPKSTISDYYDGGIPWLNTKEVHFNRIYQTERTISELGLNNSAAKWIAPHSVIVAMYGATAGNTAVNQVSLTTNQACCNLEINEVKADYRYIYYYLKLQYRKLSALANGGAQQNLNAQLIKRFEVLLPKMDVQKEIADILWTLDDKIELNNKINDNLQRQAQAVYEEMFINNPNASLTSGTLSDIAIVTMGQSPKGSSYNEQAIGEVFYQGRAEFGFRFPSRRLYTTEPKRIAEPGDVLLSVRAPVGDLNVAYERCCIGRGLGAIHSKDGHSSFILYTMFSLKPQLDVFNGEGTVFGSINRDSLNAIPVEIPSPDRIEQFEAFARPMDDLIRSNYEEICRLEALRDSLLPKLMSGEVDVSHIPL